MFFKYVTLYGIELDERSSRLKKKLGDLRVKDINILCDGNYVDVELEVVDNSINLKIRKICVVKFVEFFVMICLLIDV